MKKKIDYMLDTCICSFIMRELPIAVLEKLQSVVSKQHRIVISVITYQEMQFGLLGKKASPKHAVLVSEFLKRVDEILPWDKEAVLASVKKTGKVIILHEDTLTGGIGAEIAAVIASECFAYLDAPVVRVASLDSPVPMSSKLEWNFLPKDRFFKQLTELADY